MGGFDHYLSRRNSPIPEANRVILEAGEDLARTEVLAIDKIDHLLADGYLAAENGFHHFPDGSAYAAVLTPMPAVTVEMINWWFWWHAKDAVRYQIWYPEMHFNISSDFQGFYDDESKSYSKRLHLSTHLVTEDIGTGKEEIVINFMSPADFGFDPSRLKGDDDETIICAEVGAPDKRVWHTRMCHSVRKVDEGVEMRSRFWIGRNVKRMDPFAQNLLNAVLNKPFVKRSLIPKNIGRHMFHHCTQEYSNLASILPKVFESASS